MEPTDIEVSLTVSSCCVWSAIMSAISPGGMLEAFSMNRTLHLLQLVQLVQTRQSGISSRQFMTFVSDCFVLLCMLERDVRQCLCDTWQLIAAGSGHCLKIWICAGETGFVIPHLGVQWLGVWMRMVLCIVHTYCYVIIRLQKKQPSYKVEHHRRYVTPVPQFNVVLWIMCLAAFKKNGHFYFCSWVFGTSKHNIEKVEVARVMYIPVVVCGCL